MIYYSLLNTIFFTSQSNLKDDQTNIIKITDYERYRKYKYNGSVLFVKREKVEEMVNSYLTNISIDELSEICWHNSLKIYNLED